MISPYYNQNRKGISNYLSNDPFNIHYIRNVYINLDAKYEFGVHYGTGNGGIKCLGNNFRRIVLNQSKSLYLR